MAPPLQIPDEAREPFTFLFELPQEKRIALVESLRTTSLSIGLQASAERAAVALGKPHRQVLELLSHLGVLYQFRDSEQLSAAEMASQLLNALHDHEYDDEQLRKALASSSDDQWREFLSELLGIDSTFGVVAKAGDVLFDHQNVIRGVRVLTDVRPVFRPSSDQIAALGIVHSLKVGYVKDGDYFEDYFAMDSEDLRTMKRAIDRALGKETSLRQVISSTGIAFLEAPSNERG